MARWPGLASHAPTITRVSGAVDYARVVDWLLGRPVPIKQPLLNAQVTGQDSAQRAIYRGKIHWFWGDTNQAGYPLGLFEMSGATADLLPGKAAESRAQAAAKAVAYVEKGDITNGEHVSVIKQHSSTSH